MRRPFKKTEPERRIDWLLARRRAPRSPIRKPGLVGTLGAADQAILRFFRTKAPHDPVSEGIVKGLGLIGEHAAVWAAIGLAGAARDEERRGRWLIAAATGPGAVVVNYGVKLAIGRERPILEDHPPLARAPSKLSFPSAHSTSSMAAATALGRVEPKTRVPLYSLAGAICLSRPYLGMHYPSDVVAGIVFGLLLGGFVPGVGERTLEQRMAEFVSDLGNQPGAAAATVAEVPAEGPEPT
ncbi:MAG: phosphatase PAP2 family protein [Actinomycetota bacterium]|nr:phosphatase PAP2 family protein [Actinomycetota bacterium]